MKTENVAAFVGQSKPVRGTLRRSFRAELLKSRHGAPWRLAIIMALPFPVLAVWIALSFPQLGVPYYPWNYWYALLMPVTIVLVAVSVANADARLGNQALLSSGIPLRQAWGAKVAWCLSLSLLSNLIVFAVYAVLSLVVPAGAASIPSMLAAAVALTVVSSWMIPATLFLTMRLGTLAGIFIPMVVQLALSLAWSAVPFWPACPPTATIMLPTAFLPVLPSGEATGDGAALAAAISSTGNVAVAVSVAVVVFALLHVAGGAWLAKSEERR